ncbi:homing endonuclease associated repeat-containing protein [Halostagnicola sp. A56]|uniref:homing endonuclease associated repeat-containing protein n=1 Tax=Halostagnicola sp. A56 TaxID=1495067 RepID=UPI002100CCBC|nr:hypothetical protein [Halostagnicola sp. A56]
MNRIPDEDLLEAIRELNKKTRKTPPTRDQMDEFGEYYGRSYTLRFGSWNEAVSAAGLEPREPIDSDFLDEPESCPLCKRNEPELDFHHWRYGDEKQGCYLCRNCHDSIHEDEAQPSVNSDWLIKAVENLVNDHLEYHGDLDTHEILSRYNVTSPNLVEYAIQQIESEDDQYD